MSRYVLSGQARRDMQHIWNYIAEENLEAADKIKTELRQAMEKIAQAPGIGHVRSDVQNPRYRFKAVYSYLIVYRDDTSPLLIVRVVHGARDIGKMFRGK